MTSPTDRDDPSLGAPLVGAAAWIVAVVVGMVGYGELTLVDSMMLLAVLVVVPTAIPLHPATSPRLSTVAVLAGLTVAPALLINQGAAAAALTGIWLLGACAGLLLSLRWWWQTARRIRDLVWPAAVTYLLVGSAWLVADRLDLEPAGFAAPFVQLTAVHFHYAGFASVMLVSSAWRWHPRSRTAATAAVLTVVGSPVVAIGFTVVGMLQIVGAVMLTGGLWMLAGVTLRHVVPSVHRFPACLLVTSSVAVLVPMVLAVQWAVGVNLGTPALSIPDMVRWHGVVNAVGFALLGTIGWRLVSRQPSELRGRPAGRLPSGC